MSEDQATEEGQIDEKKSNRWANFGFAALSLAMALLVLFSSRNGLGVSLGLSPTALFEGFWFVMAAITFGYWLILHRTGPPKNLLTEELREGELGDWKRDKDFTLMAAISLVIIGLLVVLA